MCRSALGCRVDPGVLEDLPHREDRIRPAAQSPGRLLDAGSLTGSWPWARPQPTDACRSSTCSTEDRNQTFDNQFPARAYPHDYHRAPCSAAA
jgi:hypothetical protein